MPGPQLPFGERAGQDIVKGGKDAGVVMSDHPCKTIHVAATGKFVPISPEFDDRSASSGEDVPTVPGPIPVGEVDSSESSSPMSIQTEAPRACGNNCCEAKAKRKFVHEDSPEIYSMDAVVDDLPDVKLVEVTKDYTSATAAVPIPKGHVLGIFNGTRERHPNCYTVQMGEDLHVLNSGKLVRMNHSCEPNVAFVWPEIAHANHIPNDVPLESRFPRVVALRDIAAGEDITFNYATTEWKMVSPFKCNCGTRSCYGEVSGFQYLTEEQRQAISSIVAPHILRQAMRHIAANVDVPDLKLVQVMDGYVSACAWRPIPKGHKLGVFAGTREREPNLFTLQIGDDLHILNTGKFVKMNHSCDANVGFEWPDNVHSTQGVLDVPLEACFPTVVALRDIAPDEHVTFNYNTTEWHMASPFRCNCGTGQCVGDVKGYKFLDLKQRAALAASTAPHILRQAMRDYAANVDVPDIKLVQVSDGYVSAVALRPIPKGHKLGTFAGIRQRQPDLYTLQIGDDLHILNTSKFVKMNHSCNPNVAFTWPDCAHSSKCADDMPLEARCPSVVALRDIAPDEHVTFNYNTTEWKLSAPFRCNCGSAECVGQVKGYAFLNAEQRKALGNTVSPHIMRQAVRDIVMMDVPSIKLVKVTEDYTSAVAACPIPKGHVLGTFAGTRERQPDLYTLQIGDDLHILNTSKFVKMNHSCSPNVAFTWPESAYEARETDYVPLEARFPRVVALRDIAPDEHVTFNYNSTEWKLSAPFRCNCGSAECVGEVKGYSMLSPEQRHVMGDLAAPHILRQAHRQAIANVDVPDIRLVQVMDGYISAVAARPIPKGHALGVFGGTREREPDLYTLQIGERTHILNISKFVKMNHSCSPNVAFRWPDCAYDVRDHGPEVPLEARFPTVVALREIAADEHITFNYCTTEWHMASPFRCNCGTANCFGEVKGYAFLSPKQRRSMDGIVSPHILRMMRASIDAAQAVMPLPAHRTRVCVLTSSYEHCHSRIREVDDFERTPAHYFPNATVLPGGPPCESSLDAKLAATLGVKSTKLTPRFEFHMVPVNKATAFAHVRQLAHSRAFDVFFNLCDGARDADSAGIEVVAALEHFGAPFTGTDAKHYEPTKVEMKMLATYAGLKVPAFLLVKDGDVSVDPDDLTALDALRDAVEGAGLTFPVIVKHESGYDSVGMTRSSRCVTLEALQAELRSFLATYGCALVEDFIEGDEVTVLAYEVAGASGHKESSERGMVGQGGSSAALAASAAAAAEDGTACPIDRLTSALASLDCGFGPSPSRDDLLSRCATLAPIQVRFPAGETYKHFDVKWLGYEGMDYEPVRNPLLQLACREAALHAFQAILGGVGYGRVDLRVDRSGHVWFLEINPYCGLFYPPGAEASADHILKMDPVMDAKGFCTAMIEAATSRRQEQVSREPPHEVAFTARKGLGYHMRAKRDIRAGELVFCDEGGPFQLVSRHHVEARWPSHDRVTFGQYAWPVEKNVFVIWNSDFHQWRPLNHSCEPNCWFGPDHSFNVFARRDIAKGESLTMDYATFCAGEYFVPFNCMCGSAKCRGKITGADYANNPEVKKRYGTRVTSYIYQM
eukprot:jgi/Mesvir1/1772/Mv09622-RA.1